VQPRCWLCTTLCSVLLSREGLIAVRSGIVTRRKEIMLGTVLLIVLVLLLIGAIPSWPHSRGWGYGPSGLLGFVAVVVVVLLVMGRI
jgi:hypothetical protein